MSALSLWNQICSQGHENRKRNLHLSAVLKICKIRLHRESFPQSDLSHSQWNTTHSALTMTFWTTRINICSCQSYGNTRLKIRVYSQICTQRHNSEQSISSEHQRAQIWLWLNFWISVFSVHLECNRRNKKLCPKKNQKQQPNKPPPPPKKVGNPSVPTRCPLSNTRRGVRVWGNETKAENVVF